MAAITCALVVSSCGGGDTLDLRAAREIGGAYELLADAVGTGDRAEARRILQDLIRSVEELRDAGAIDAARAAAILAAASDVSAALRVLPAPTVSPSPSPSPLAPETTDPEEDEDDEGITEDEGEGDDEGGNGSGNDGEDPGNSGGQGNGNGNAHGHDKD